MVFGKKSELIIFRLSTKPSEIKWILVGQAEERTNYFSKCL